VHYRTPGAIGFKNIIPDQVYNIVKNKKKFEQSMVLMTTHNKPNYNGQPVTRSEYDWGSRFTPGDGKQYFDSEKDITDRLSGMVSMDGENRSGKKISSGYFTFRIISASPNAKGWIKPAMRARPVTQAVANLTRGTINDIVEGAVMEDLGL
jgi:hypothetical protein